METNGGSVRLDDGQPGRPAQTDGSNIFTQSRAWVERRYERFDEARAAVLTVLRQSDVPIQFGDLVQAALRAAVEAGHPIVDEAAVRLMIRYLKKENAITVDYYTNVRLVNPELADQAPQKAKVTGLLPPDQVRDRNDIDDSFTNPKSHQQ
ncbi:hypothetical protein FWD20_02495 [Candidatus Saccharibacteria bacterium]|nr:hypothetical protein [Candidatus Saccharibacteria bacterium]